MKELHFVLNFLTFNTLGNSCGYKLSLGGNFGGFSLRLCANCCVCNINCSRVAATCPCCCPFPPLTPFVPKPELPELPPPLPATLYGSSSGIGILGRFFISTGRCTVINNNKKKFIRDDK